MNTKKDIIFEVTENKKLSDNLCLLKVKPMLGQTVGEIFPGQFVNILVEGRDIFLRRPISICNYDHLKNEIWLLVKTQGKGSGRLYNSEISEELRILYPLGKGFTLPHPSNRVLLIGGGVGMAPLFFLGKWLKLLEIEFSFLIGGRSEEDIVMLDELRSIGDVNITTEDGSIGETGLVVHHSIYQQDWDRFYVCGPLPMMKAIASDAAKRNIWCEVSLENHMACGLGACLCCVEDTQEGNLCVCKEGPVFNIQRLKW